MKKQHCYAPKTIFAIIKLGIDYICSPSYIYERVIQLSITRVQIFIFNPMQNLIVKIHAHFAYDFQILDKWIVSLLVFMSTHYVNGNFHS
jgi:hypothetical protein